MNNLSKFTRLYNLSKTIRFELRSMGETAEWIIKNEEVEKDEKRSLAYPQVKVIIDNYHKYFLQNALKKVCVDWIPLYDAMRANLSEKSEESKKVLDTEQAKMRNHIFEIIKKASNYKDLTAATPKELIEIVLPNFCDTEEEKSALLEFKMFSTYFVGFQENRKNIYTDEAISTAAPYRLVNDNFPKFMADIDVYDKLKEKCPEVLKQAEEELSVLLENNGYTLDEFFQVDFYNNLLTQDMIDFFNQVIGGVSLEDKTKLRGINEFANLYCQQHPETGIRRSSVTMQPLFKQILSDRETMSYIPRQIENDRQLWEMLYDFHNNVTNYSVNGETINLIHELVALLSKIDSFPSQNIFMRGKYVSEVSQQIYKNWNHINEYLIETAISKYGNPEKSAKAKKKVDAYLKSDAFSIEELGLAGEDTNINQYFADMVRLSEQTISGKWLAVCEVVKTEKTLKNNPVSTECIKEYLDSVMELLHKCEVLMASENYDLDKSFYNVFMPMVAELSAAISVYNVTRNYLTQKATDVKKFKINFDSPTLAKGWDKNKEKDNKAIILRKDGLYYLAIVKQVAILKEKLAPFVDSYDKMVYKYLPGPNKMLPKVFFSKKGIDDFCPSQYILDGYKAGRFKQGPTFDIVFLHKLIDFYKDAIARHKDWSKFNFKFQPTESYNDISSFYNDISMQNYMLSFEALPCEAVKRWVKDGKMYLFQIYNKDYASGAHGRKNMHTLYWENVFSEKNLKNIIIKLNGEAELFYRPKAISKPVVHNVGSKLVNRRDRDGMPIPNNVYIQLLRFYNDKLAESELSVEAKAYLGNVIVKEATHEIVKDRRFTSPSFFFHVPLTFNKNSADNVKMNDMVRDFLSDNPDVNIIGIDRGERHLIYLTLINQKGDILKQKTYNTVSGYNYHDKLDQREKERDQARKSWESVGKIKELKEGFLSAVVHEIAQMMVDYNAIVVLEDLNFGFKRGRFKVEKQVYQKFEKMLIDKLNYLVFKDCENPLDAGGVLNAYQLTQKFESFQKMGKQTGFLFYIPAAYTSKIDPVTGFVNHFNFTDINSAVQCRDFLMKMDAIKVKGEDVEFTFDYRNFKTYQTDWRNSWTVNTRGKRIVARRDKSGHIVSEDIYPSDIIRDALKGIADFNDGIDIKNILSGLEPSKAVDGFKSILFAFKKTLQMRNSNAATEEDFIISPVADKNGKYFCSYDEANKGRDESRQWISKLPVDADANGAYHIALKGLYLLRANFENNLKIEHAQWLRFMAEKPYKE